MTDEDIERLVAKPAELKLIHKQLREDRIALIDGINAWNRLKERPFRESITSSV